MESNKETNLTRCFSKKTDTILLSLSILALALSSVLIAVSGNLLFLIGDFLKEKIFHRDFDVMKWSDTIFALVAFPIFFVIFIDSVLFVKFREKTKIILVATYLAVIVFFIAYCAFLRCNDFIDSDMASEILLAKECYRLKTPLPSTWYYATEIRILNNQLVSAPLFLFTSNLVTIKALTTIISSLFVPLTLLFLLNQMEIKRWWVKLFCCLISVAPWSLTHWGLLQFGNYYIPHVSLAFLTVGLFLALAYHQQTKRKYLFFFVCYAVLSLLNGMAGIRYLIQFHFPLAAMVVIYFFIKLLKENKDFSFKSFFIENKLVFYSCVGFVLCIFGYLLNCTLLKKICHLYCEYNTEQFNAFGMVKLSDWVGEVFKILGFKDWVSFATPGGVVNVFLFLFVPVFLWITLKYIKLNGDCLNVNFFIVLFAVVDFAFNAFITVNAEDYKGRYFLTYVFWLVPCLAVFLEEVRIFNFHRYALGVIASVVFITSSFTTFVTVLSTTKNTDKVGVAEFLNKSDYDFGWGTFWDANLFTFLTNGKIEFGHLYDIERDGKRWLEDKFSWSKWLTLSWYYDDDYKQNQKIILVVQNHQKEERKHNLFDAGKIVYIDDFYTVFEYENQKIFKEAFDK